MIVDDNADMRSLMKHIVRKVCDAVFECDDGDAVLTAYDAYDPDWVVTDVEMKRMDGIKATAHLISHHPQAKVIIVTKHVDADTRKAAREAGAISFVEKDNLLSLRSILGAASYH